MQRVSHERLDSELVLRFRNLFDNVYICLSKSGHEHFDVVLRVTIVPTLHWVVIVFILFDCAHIFDHL